MKRTWIASLVSLCCFAALPALAQTAATISVRGAVAQPGEFSWQSDTRLLNASIAANVNHDAWYQGAALLRQSAMRDQQKLKRGLLFDLQTANVNARALGLAGTSELLKQWERRIAGTAVTGRIAAELNPLKQRLLAFNPLLEPGDQIIYPNRPHQVRVLGAVQQDCVLEFAPTLDPLDYREACPLHEAANSQYLYIIQPDGKVELIGTAYWNAEDAWVAVGALLYVPFKSALFGTSRDEFNNEMAQWLATQYELTGGYHE